MEGRPAAETSAYDDGSIHECRALLYSAFNIRFRV